VITRERGGRSFPFVTTSEAAGVPAIVAKVAPGSTVYADEASALYRLAAKYLTKRINHQEAYSMAEPVQTGRKATSAASAGPSLASTTISRAST
jgi:hypothetical protein